MKLYPRENYLKQLRGFYHDVEIIKVIVGMRRCGKSCLMQTVVDELRASGVDENAILYVNLDKRGFRRVKTPEQLEAIIEPFAARDGVKYLFIDEIQNVKGFEEVVNGFREDGSFSIFITGSNSYLLSGELVTKLTGRYLEFEVFPLTFDEYLGMKRFLGVETNPNVAVEFDGFLREGGLPRALYYENLEDKWRYVRGTVSEIIEKDVRRRVKVRNVSTFEKVKTYLINNFGAPTNLTNLLETFHKDGVKIRRETLNRYVQILIDAKLIYLCERFDLKSRRSVSGEQKYYLADLGIYYATNTDVRVNYGPALENVAYIYARAKGYAASVGRIGNLECDFILRRGTSEYSYVQVAMTMMNDLRTENREYAPLEKIQDNYPKYVVTRNDPIQKRNGVIHVNMGEFMKDGSLF